MSIKDEDGSVRAVQPFFIIDQDLLLGTNTRLGAVIGFVRRLWPRFMKMRTLMVGCAAGEGHLDGAEQLHRANAEILAASITSLAGEMNAPLIVLKEFSAQYRDSLQCLVHHGFARVPSMPNTRLNIDYANFDDYMNKALGREMRRNLRRKFKAAEEASVIEMTVVDDVAPIVEDIYPLYLKVYERSKLKFEKLTERYFCDLGRLMPDKARFLSGAKGKRSSPSCRASSRATSSVPNTSAWNIRSRSTCTSIFIRSATSCHGRSPTASSGIEAAL